MKTTTAILSLIMLIGCRSPSNLGVPAENWPEFVPLSQIEKYLGFSYPTPTLGQIYGKPVNLKVISEATNVIALLPGEYRDGFVTLELSRDYLAYMPVIHEMQLPHEEVQLLKEILLNYDTYGDNLLCPSKVAMGYRFDVGHRWVDVTIGFDCHVVGVWPIEGHGDQRAAAPILFEFSERILQRLNEESEQRVPGYRRQSAPQPEP